MTEDGETTTTDYAGGPDSDPVGYTFSYQDNPLPTVCENDDERSATVLSDEISMGETYYCFTARTNGDLNDSANNKLTTVVDAQGDTRSQSYSADNQPEVFTDSSGSTVNTYGNAGSGLMDQLRKTDSAKDTGDTETNTSASDEGASKTYKYGADSSIPGSKYLPTSVVDGNNDCTAYGYDGQGRQNRTWVGRNPDNNNRCDQSTGGLLYQANYNNDGTVAWMSDPNANNDGANPTQAQKTIYTYWQSGQTGFVPGTTGQMKTMRRPGGDCASGSSRSLCTAFTYDGLARTLTTADGRGVATRSRYDTMDRTTESLANGATSCQPASGECITYDYDAAGNLIERQDQQGATTFGYDRLNRKITQSTPDGVSIDYGYNQDSRMTTLTQNLPGQSPDTVTYNYDTAGDLNAVLDADGKIDIGYDNNHRLQSTVFRTSPKLTRIERTYTNAGMPRRLIVRSGTSTYDGMVDYRYVWTENMGTENDPWMKDTNQIHKLFVTNATSAINYKSTFAYTNRGQLTSETRENGGGASSSFTYDNAGNLATATRGGTARHYGYDQANQLCWTGTSDGTSPVATCPSSAPGSSQIVARDAAGNSEGDPTASIDYNARSQAETIAGQDQGYYDQGNDLRVTTGSTHLVNTRTGITARTTDTDGTGTPTGPDAETTFYTRMPDGRLLSARGPDGTFFYITDHHKTVLGLVDAAGARAGTYRYDPYGEPTLVEGTTAEQSNPFRWISGYQNNTDQPGGYYKLGARYYNPTTGAFTQPDPEPGNMGQPLRLNPYLYSAGDPINKADASGRFWGGYGELSGQYCVTLCLNAALGYDGDPDLTLGVSFGPDFGGAVGLGGGLGSNEGWQSPTVECSGAVGPYGGYVKGGVGEGASISGGGGYQLGLEGGCSTGISYTL